ncbi:MAG: tRNA (guanosine(46)-N7)-methyltransferase TrmB [Bacteroidales bacterium]|nr:tRNA (guanosine(46)-N7)-methyltransferase TrmB [Bacteroidales bacterium]
MGKNKLQRFQENKGFKNLYEPSFQEVYRKDYPLKGHWTQKVFKNNHPIVLELGCGKGEYTLALAEHHKRKNFIGIDIKGARLWRGAKTALEKKIENVAFIRTRIELIESFFAAGEVSEIWITFPDPQPKKEKKRLTSPGFLNRYLTFLQPDAIIHLKTDSRPLHDYTRQVVEEWEGMQLLEADTDIYGSGRQSTDPLIAVRTFYEEMFLAEGKPITYLKFSIKTGQGIATLQE